MAFWGFCLGLLALFFQLSWTSTPPRPTPTPASPVARKAGNRSPRPTVHVTPKPTLRTAQPQPTHSLTVTPSPSSPVVRDYVEIDRHAVTAPHSVETDLRTLSTYLCKPARNDREKARAIFRWITERIAYDYPALLSKNYPDPSPEATLKTHLAVCAGYARLFQALAELAGLKSEIVGGHCKGEGFNDAPGPDNSHAWNAILLDGHWFLIDSTWGAGHINSGKVYQRGFNPFYFLAPPEQLIYTHYPKESRWQCLDKPLSLQHFLDQPRLNSKFFATGLELITPRKGLIQARVPFQIVLEGPPDLSVLAQLGDGEGSALVSRKGRKFTIEVSPPRPGESMLHIFAGRGESKLPGVLDFRVKALAASSPLPVAYNSFETQQVELLSPRQGVLYSSRSEHFNLTIPGATDAFVQNAGRRLPLHREGDQFTGSCELNDAEATVFALFAGSEYQGLLRYAVKNESP